MRILNDYENKLGLSCLVCMLSLHTVCVHFMILTKYRVVKYLIFAANSGFVFMCEFTNFTSIIHQTLYVPILETKSTLP